jgi:hypothetical protein
VKAGFKDSMFSAGGGVATFGKEEAGIVTSADWATGFVTGVGIDTDVPNPGNAVVAPPNRGLGGARIVPSFFSPNCAADEGVRLNGSGLLLNGCVDNVDVGWVCVCKGGPKRNGVGAGGLG